MTLSPRFPLVVGLALLAGCQARPGPLSEADVAAIRSNTDQWTKTANTGDWAKLATMYADNATMMPPNGPAVQGRSNIQAWMTAYPKMQEIAIKAAEIQGSGDVAYARGTYALTLAPQGTAPPMKDSGKYLEIHRKQPDGSWKIVVDIFNSDLPVAPPEPAKPMKAAKPAKAATPAKAARPKAPAKK